MRASMVPVLFQTATATSTATAVVADPCTENAYYMAQASCSFDNSTDRVVMTQSETRVGGSGLYNITTSFIEDVFKAGIVEQVDQAFEYMDGSREGFQVSYLYGQTAAAESRKLMDDRDGQGDDWFMSNKENEDTGDDDFVLSMAQSTFVEQACQVSICSSCMILACGRIKVSCQGDEFDFCDGPLPPENHTLYALAHHFLDVDGISISDEQASGTSPMANPTNSPTGAPSPPPSAAPSSSPSSGPSETRFIPIPWEEEEEDDSTSPPDSGSPESVTISGAQRGSDAAIEDDIHSMATSRRGVFVSLVAFSVSFAMSYV